MGGEAASEKRWLRRACGTEGVRRKRPPRAVGLVRRESVPGQCADDAVAGGDLRVVPSGSPQVAGLAKRNSLLCSGGRLPCGGEIHRCDTGLRAYMEGGRRGCSSRRGPPRAWCRCCSHWARLAVASSSDRASRRPLFMPEKPVVTAPSAHPTRPLVPPSRKARVRLSGRSAPGGGRSSRCCARGGFRWTEPASVPCWSPRRATGVGVEFCVKALSEAGGGPSRQS